MDEDTLVIPLAWRRRLHPRRGGTPVAVTLDAGAGATLRSRIEDQADEIEELLGNAQSDPGLVAAARRYLAGEDDPLGAAVVGQIVFRRADWRDDPYPSLVDAWCAERGAAFAAAAVTGISKSEPTWRWIEMGKVSEAWVRLRDPEEEYGHWWSTRSAIRRIRAVLAVADDAEYERAVARLAECRDNFLLRMVTAYIVPTRQDWVNESLAELGVLRHMYDWMLWCSVESAEQLPPLGPLRGAATQPDLLTTAVEGVGAAMAPMLAHAYDTAHRADGRKHSVELLAILPSDEAFQALIDRADKDRVRPALVAAMKRFPKRAARLLAAAAAGQGKAAAIAADLVAPEAVSTGVPEASMADLPRVLADPPWKRERPARELVVIKDLAVPHCDAVTWMPEEREAWSSSDTPAEYWAGQIAEFEAGKLSDWEATILLADGPEASVRPLFKGWKPQNLPAVEWRARQLGARYELDAVPLLIDIAARNPGGNGEALLPFLTMEIAALMADWALRLKSARHVAFSWFKRHRIAAAMALMPAALGPAGRQRQAAEAALLHIAGREGDEAIVEAARVHGERAAAAIADLMTTDPVPLRVPKVSEWADPERLPQVLLKGRDRALPAAAARHLLTMLALSAPDAPYAGITEVRAACDPGSLAAFSWAIFERWQLDGAPAKDGWALGQLGLIGGDEAARRLTPLIKVWPGQSRHKNASAGLDVLAAIGSDIALTHLHGIAQKLKFKGLKRQAQEKIDQIAADRGLTQEELADRLVPDLGLGPDGSLVLDYGPRRFTVGFDEQLKPYVRDEGGKPRQTLPKPGAKDDPELAPAAYKRFTALKKDVRAVATSQIQRLETAMIERREWSLPDFQRLLVAHPLLRHIARRLVWLAGDGTSFRVAEDGTFADSADDTCTLPSTASVRIAHPLDLSGSLATWSEVFADYEIAQPFPQLGRPVHALTPAERETGRLERFENVPVPLGRLLALERRGWEHEIPADAGIVGSMSRHLPGGAEVQIGFDTAVAIGHRDPTQEVTIAVSVSGDLDPIVASELLADLTAVTGRPDA
ncbi:DUF4132 domain-containing protein [Actinomadura rudentiformis]|uniref:DUF4132 domain-containing protein n=1 Tax=Actinomadura rudentiformis TaxID=359158 RepID=A0A6H9Z4V4_9ACTN|nr:DUF4132 domain-containing protein [Actinomadura rudentiformis]KAB2348522.1 DUF4132 domain-containing protein [Actinomadura rudentiformis]